jgi:agmatine deiminase
MTANNTLTTAMAALVAITSGCASSAPYTHTPTKLLDGDVRRTPAEWETQEAVWLQWPRPLEGARVEAVFTDIVRVVAQYETVRLLAANPATQRSGEAALAGIEGDITWYQVPVAASWMRDNGPRYVELDGEMVLQNWAFDGYHDGRPGWMWEDDDKNPDDVAKILGMPLEWVGLVHERGDLEVNGSDTAMVNWSVVGHRNPGMTRAEATAIFKETLGVSRVIYLEGFHPQDVTRGHTDGLARFISADTVVVPHDGSALFDDAAAQIAEQAPDLTVLRLELWDNDPTLNWLVGDGFLLTGSTGDAAADAELAIDLEGYFPGRDVHFIDVQAIWNNGGGVHCVTNDQPASR